MAKTQTLREYFAETGEKQEDFADRVGKTKQMIWMLVAGKTRPGLDLALTIQEATRGRVPVEIWKRPEEPEAEEAGDVAV